MKAAYENNGKTVSAEAFYAVACDPRRSVAVEACAGAGKTWMLVSRIVRALLDGVDAQSGQLRVLPQEILAITFTKRAASEMRERLYQWLAEFAAADESTLLQELRSRGIAIQSDSQDATLLPVQLSNLYRRILESGHQVQVRTFHSWFAALLRSAPLGVLQQMALPTDYELLEDDASAKALVWRRFYAALAVQGDVKADYEAVVFDYGRAQTEKALQTALDKRTEFALADAQGVVLRSVLNFSEQYPEFAALEAPDDFFRVQPQRWQTLLEAAKVLGRASAKTYAAKGVELETALSQGDISAALAALLTQEGTARKFGEKIVGIEQVRCAQELALCVAAARSQHATWLYQQRMTRLARLLLKEYAALKRERGWVDMNDVERTASVLLSDPLLSGWLQERLDVRIKHLLIDEFQDTNPLQWQALKSWLSGYAGAGGGSSGAAGASAPSVFIVGDPKQSIYRFRRAEPQVFKAAQAFVRDGLQGDLLSCDHTRRNAAGVIGVVNAVMSEATQTDGYEGFRSHTTSSLELGFVGTLPPIARTAVLAGVASNDAVESSETDWRDSLSTPRELPQESLRTLEARQATSWIVQQLVSRVPADRELPREPASGCHCERSAAIHDPGLHGLPRRCAPRNDGTGLQAADIMVLARKRAALLTVQDELRRLHIPAQIGEKTDLIECCEVQDMVALLDVLVSRQHDLSLARVLKSPLFNLGDDALVQLALAQRETALPWFDLLEKVALTTPDQRSIAACLLRWQTWLDALPPHDALQAIYTDGDVLARFASAAPHAQRDVVLANLRALLGVSLELGGGRFSTPYAFVRNLKAGSVLAPAAVNPQAVRLLTIHGAKGLEAKVVLLLDTDNPERNAESMGVLIDWPGEAAWPTKFVFLASESKPPVCAALALAVEQRERQREELNALYVAMTRARHTLVISSIEPYRATERSWWQRLAMLAQPVTLPVLDDTAPPASTDTERAVAGVFYLPELPSFDQPDRPVTVKTMALDAAQAQDAVLARIGCAMHRLLQWGDASGHSILAAAREFDLTPEQGRQAAAMAHCILRGEGAWAWDPAVVIWQGNEVDLCYQGQTLRLDRLVQRQDGEHAGQWWVLDYKSARSPQDQPALVQQLRGYRAAVQAIYPNALVKAAFLTASGDLIEVSHRD